jgi:hypothetical protein
VDPLPGAFIVNIGEMLEVASGGYLRATEHRVKLSARERISVPYSSTRASMRRSRADPARRVGGLARGVTADPSNERIFSVYGRNAGRADCGPTPTSPPRTDTSQVKMEMP